MKYPYNVVFGQWVSREVGGEGERLGVRWHVLCNNCQVRKYDTGPRRVEQPE